MNKRTCYRCGEIKPFTSEYFVARKEVASGLKGLCKLCDAELSKIYYQKNKKAKLSYSHNHYEANKEEILKRHNDYNHDNKEEISIQKKQYRKKNKEIIKVKKAEYYNNNKKVIDSRNIAYSKTRKETDLGYKITEQLRKRLYATLKNNIQGERTKELFGCDLDYLKSHLEHLFKDGMTWDNYGHGGWVIDHVQPCCDFDLTDVDQQRECFHFINLQPLWEYENREKGNKSHSTWQLDVQMR